MINKGKGIEFNIRYLYHIQLTINFPGIGHTLLEHFYLPWENKAHTSYRYEGILSHSGTITVHNVPFTAG